MQIHVGCGLSITKLDKLLQILKCFPHFVVVVVVVFFFFHVNLYAKGPAILVGQEPKQLCQQ